MANAPNSSRTPPLRLTDRNRIGLDLQDIYHYFGSILEAYGVRGNYDCTFRSDTLRRKLDNLESGNRKLRDLLYNILPETYAAWEAYTYDEMKWWLGMDDVEYDADSISSEQEIKDQCLYGMAFCMEIAASFRIDPSTGDTL